MLTPPHVAALLGETPGLVWPDHVLAYIGPGMGLGALAIAIALALGVLLLLIGLVWYPLKRLFNGRPADGASGSRADEVE